MRYLLAVEDPPRPLLLSSPERLERRAEELDFAPVLRPVPRSLRRDRPVVVRLRLPQQLVRRARRA